MPSFDIVSEVDKQEIDNAVNQTHKEISTRFDFRGGLSSIAYDKETQKITINADDEFKLRSITTILEQKMAKRSVDLGCLQYGKQEEAGGRLLRQVVEIKSGIDKENAKKITKMIKDSKLKVQAQIQDEQVRVTGKKIDDLQEVMAMLKAGNVGIALQYVNMRS